MAGKTEGQISLRRRLYREQDNIKFCLSEMRSRDSVVIVPPRLWDGQPKNCGSSPSRGQKIYLRPKRLD